MSGTAAHAAGVHDVKVHHKYEEMHCCRAGPPPFIPGASGHNVSPCKDIINVLLRIRVTGCSD